MAGKIITAISAPRALSAKSRNARRISIYFRSRRDSTTSKDAFLNISVMAVASLAGLVSAATFW